MARKSKKKSGGEISSLGFKKMWLGGMLVIFAGLWVYYNSMKMALLVVGLLVFLAGFLMTMKKK